MRLFVILIFFCLPFVSVAQPLRQHAKDISPPSADNIIPKPVSVLKGPGKPVTINNRTVIYSDPGFLAQARYLKAELSAQTGLVLTVATTRPAVNTPAVILRLDTIAVTKPEMYILSIGNKQVILKARDVKGLVNGIQSLLQLLPLQKTRRLTLQPVNIEDYPRFAYRGMHLDVSRHFSPVKSVKKYIDYLTFHKFNTFHWHLTDDQGWRIEIKSYPKLTEIGAWRDSTLIGHHRTQPYIFDGKRHGGFYTQEQVKDIIAYATVRGITIIPEIDIPGHSRAAIASYPELSTNPDTTWQVATKWGMYNRENNVLAPTAATFEFLRKTFDEIADLFPSPYIHLGGDECSKMWWKADPKSQAFIKKHGLKDEAGLQTYMIQQVVNNLKLKGKKVIGWDEILEGELDPTAVVMNWRKVKEAVKAAEAKHNIIMTPEVPLYFNLYQSKARDTLAIYGHTTLDMVYKYEPVPDTIKAMGMSHHILGAQGNLWSEYLPNWKRVEYMIFPRMTALSEVLWSPEEKRDLSDFKRRLRDYVVPRYKFWDSHYFFDWDKPDK